MTDTDCTIRESRVRISLGNRAYHFAVYNIGPRTVAVLDEAGETVTCQSMPIAREYIGRRVLELDAAARQAEQEQEPEPPTPAGAVVPLPSYAVNAQALCLPALVESANGRAARAKANRRRFIRVVSRYGRIIESGAPILLHSVSESSALKRFILHMKAGMDIQIQSIIDAEREAAGEWVHDGDARWEAHRRKMWATQEWLNAYKTLDRYLLAYGYHYDITGGLRNFTQERLERERNITRVRELAATAREEQKIAA